MILKKLEIQYFGPFAFPTTLEIDPEVTVLTGANDTGKSSVLKLLRMICNQQQLTLDEVNAYRILESPGAWSSDNEIACTATFTTERNIDRHFNGAHLGSVKQVELIYRLASQGNNPPQIGRMQHEQVQPAPNVQSLKRYPAAFILPPIDEIKPVIQIDSMSGNEAHLMKMAFGESPAEKLSALSGVHLTKAINRGSEKLNSLLRPLMPPSTPLQFIFEKESVGPLKLGIVLRDQHDGDTHINLRGVGVRKIINLLLPLLSVDLESEQYLILIDEPENSLHADAQHVFRSFLEALAKRPTVQVIYATHSSAMINSLKCEGLRLLKRVNRDGKATTEIINHPVGDNFYPVRLSLGISPADSLLYAPITLILEGKTELRALPILLRRLANENISGFESVLELLSLTHVVDGHGDKFDKWCGMAESQGSKAVAFVDGDKQQRVVQFKQQYPDIPIIELPPNTEFEEIVPREGYFSSLAAVYGDDLTVASFDEWLNKNKQHTKRLFSKRIERWLDDEFPSLSYDKDEVMKHVTENAPLAQFRLDELRELVNAMRKVANS